MKLPQPECRYGYTERQLAEILGPLLERFQKWFAGQTGSICENRVFDHETKTYHTDNCGPHGFVVYPWDLERFLQRLPPLD